MTLLAVLSVCVASTCSGAIAIEGGAPAAQAAVARSQDRSVAGTITVEHADGTRTTPVSGTVHLWHAGRGWKDARARVRDGAFTAIMPQGQNIS